MPNSYSLAVLIGLQHAYRHIYAGTVPAHVIAKRRARNKMAKMSRRVNRGR